MNGTLAAECLALSTGLFPNRAPSTADVKRAMSLIGRAEAELRKFLRADVATEYTPERLPPQEELHTSLAEPIDDATWEVDHVPAETAAQWIIVLNLARKYAFDKWPIFDAEGLEPANFSLAVDEFGDIGEIVRAIDGVEQFWSELHSCTLSPEQVAAVQSCYPDWYEVISQGLFNELVEIQTKGRKLRPEQEDMIRVMQQLPDLSPILLQPTQSKATQGPAKTTQKQAQTAQTRGEAIESKQQSSK